MNFHIVIPARHASSRLPGKPLRELAGKPMLQWVHERAVAAGADAVIVATDDPRIEACARGFGAEVCLTRPDHESGTERLSEVIATLGWPDDAIVVNLQGDEPLTPPAIIGQVAANLAAHADASVATLAAPIDDMPTLFNPAVVKVVTDVAGYALYFSRAPIPWHRDGFAQGAGSIPAAGYRRHIGLYAYRAGFVREYVGWAPCPLERIEMLEQLRVLWHGRRIHVADALEVPAAGVDTPEDLERVAALLGG